MAGPSSDKIDRAGLLLFLALITLAMLTIMRPFLTPMLWAVLAAILFQPMFRWFCERLNGRENWATGLSLLVIVFAVVMPAMLLGGLVVDEAAGLVVTFQSGDVELSDLFEKGFEALPGNIQQSLETSGWGNFKAFQDRIQEFLQASLGLIAQQAIAVSGSVFGFAVAFGVGLYAAFFLLRDGTKIADNVLEAMPLERPVADRLGDSFVSVVRATIKGSVIVGIVQGALASLVFWAVGLPSVLLLGVLVAIASFVPAVGTGLVLVPIIVYFLLTGAIWQAIVVAVAGAILIGGVDNLLRPILVGRDTGIPDWIILVTTLGGISLLGLSGIVVGPLVAGLFLTGWTIFSERRAPS